MSRKIGYLKIVCCMKITARNEESNFITYYLSSICNTDIHRMQLSVTAWPKPVSDSDLKTQIDIFICEVIAFSEWN